MDDYSITLWDARFNIINMVETEAVNLQDAVEQAHLQNDFSPDAVRIEIRKTQIIAPPKPKAMREAELLETAKRLLLEKPRSINGNARVSGCTSYLQRKLEIGYNQAARLLTTLEEQNFISPAGAGGFREFINQEKS